MDYPWKENVDFGVKKSSAQLDIEVLQNALIFVHFMYWEEVLQMNEKLISNKANPISFKMLPKS
jgi:hypothetical protein